MTNSTSSDEDVSMIIGGHDIAHARLRGCYTHKASATVFYNQPHHEHNLYTVCQSVSRRTELSVNDNYGMLHVLVSALPLRLKIHRP